MQGSDIRLLHYYCFDFTGPSAEPSMKPRTRKLEAQSRQVELSGHLKMLEASASWGARIGIHLASFEVSLDFV